MSNRAVSLLSMSMLFLCDAACNMGNEQSWGFRVDLAKSQETCGDGRSIVAVAIGGHRARLNAERDAAFPKVAQRLREVMSYRAEKVLYIKAEPQVPWTEFLELVDQVWPDVQVVSILTPQVEAMARRTLCLSPSCRDCTRLGGFPRATDEGR
jgi:hypothetical protein